MLLGKVPMTHNIHMKQNVRTTAFLSIRYTSNMKCYYSHTANNIYWLTFWKLTKFVIAQVQIFQGWKTAMEI